MKKIIVGKEELKRLNDILDMEEIDFEKENIKEDAVLFEESVYFDEDKFALIQVCTGQHNAYVNAVLFEKGQEVNCLDGEAGLDGEYLFNYNNTDYTVVIEAE